MYINKIIEKITWKTVLVFAIFFLCFYYLIHYRPFGTSVLLQITGGNNILDMEFGYTYDFALQKLNDLGVEGRAFYVSKISPLDFPFPLSYGLFLSAFIACLIKNVKIKQWMRCLVLAPIVGMTFDWIENIGIIVMLKNYPALPVWSIYVSSIASTIKFLFIGISIFSIVGLSIVYILNKSNNKIVDVNR